MEKNCSLQQKCFDIENDDDDEDEDNGFHIANEAERKSKHFELIQ